MGSPLPGSSGRVELEGSALDEPLPGSSGRVELVGFATSTPVDKCVTRQSPCSPSANALGVLRTRKSSTCKGLIRPPGLSPFLHGGTALLRLAPAWPPSMEGPRARVAEPWRPGHAWLYELRDFHPSAFPTRLPIYMLSFVVVVVGRCRLSLHSVVVDRCRSSLHVVVDCR